MSRRIKEGALFIADAHLNENRDDFYKFLLFLKKLNPLPPQLFLLGDMFDLLSFKIDYTKKIFSKEIVLLRYLSKRVKIYYFEGNHDFVLKPIFKDIEVISLKKQPALFFYEDKKILISHGDIFENLSYNLYSKIIRNEFLLSVLNFIDRVFGFFISRKILKSQAKKEPCRRMENFKDFIKERLKRYEKCDLVIEGHHHQNRFFKEGEMEYVNLSSFACDRRVFEFRKGKIKEFDYDKNTVFGG